MKKSKEKYVTACLLVAWGAAAHATAIRGDGELDYLFPGYEERIGGEAVYDSGRDRLVRYGSVGYLQGDPLTSEWDGLGWYPVETDDVPSIQDGFAMVYDATRSNVVLFGGSPVANETWLYDGINWTNALPITSPPPRQRHAMVYDSVRERVVLFGGDPGSGCTNLSDTWEWDGTNWLEILTLTSPGRRMDHQMVFDPVRNLAILYRGSYYKTCSPTYTTYGNWEDMWEYDGVNWSSNTPPSLPTWGGHLVFNPDPGLVELFATFGSSSFDLFTYDATNWTSQTINSSPGNSHREQNLVYINSTGTAVYVSNEGTWLWNPSSWEAQFHSEPLPNKPSAWADIDGDGRLDRVSATQIRPAGGSSQVSGKALHLHDGINLDRMPAWFVDDSVSLTDIALGDVDGDGQPDAAFATTGIRPIELYNNTGGAFSTWRDWRSDDNDNIQEIQFTDFDVDGDLDLVAVRVDSGMAGVLVFRNEGGALNGTPYIEYVIPQSGLGTDARLEFVHSGRMSWADVDYDGQQECAVSHYYSTEGIYEVSLLKVSGTNLVEIMRLDDLEGPLGFADVNVDGYPDLLAHRDNVGPVLFLNQAGTLDSTPAWTGLFMGRAPYDLAIADFDGDGDPDFALGSYSGSAQSLGHLLFRNDGGTFDQLPSWQSRRHYGRDGSPGETVALMDFDGDGILDVATERGVYLLARTLRDTVPPQPPRYATAYASPPGSTSVRVEWDASVDPDVAGYRVYRGFGRSGEHHILIDELPASATNYTDPGLKQGFSEFYVRAIDEVGNLGPWSLAERAAYLPAIRLAGDAKPDFSISGWVEVGDVTGDGKAEMFTTRQHETEHNRDYSFALYQDLGGGVFTDLWSLRRGRVDPSISRPYLLKDATGDGMADLLLPFNRMVNVGGSNVLRQVLEVWPSTGTGFSTNAVFSLTIDPDAIDNSVFRSFDWGNPDGDGDLDLVIAPFGSEHRAAVFLNQGGVFATVPDWTSSDINIESAAFGNLNNDGRDDLLLGEDVNNGSTRSRMDIHVHNGTAGGPRVTPTWSDLSPGTDANGNPVALSWADFDQDSDDDVSVFTRHAIYAYRNTAGTLPANYSLFFAQNGGSKPSHLLRGWANIDNTGVLDIWGENSVILNAGTLSGAYSDSNLGSWEHLVASHPFYTDGIDHPWSRINASFAGIEHVTDLTGDGVAELITDQAGMVLFNASGTFPPVLEQPPDSLVILPPGPVFLGQPGDTIALSVYAVYTNGTSNNVTADVLWDIGDPDDGVEVIRMSNNVVIAVQPSSSGDCGLTADWSSLDVSVNVVVGNAPLIPRSLRIVPGTSTLTRVGELLPFTALLTYEGGMEVDITPEVILLSSDPTSVGLDGSVGIAMANGAPDITGDYLGLGATATVNVALSVGVVDLSVTPVQSSIAVGGTRSFEVRANYGDGSSESVTHFSTLTSLDPSVASMSNNVATGVSRGSAGIQAEYAGITAGARVAVFEDGLPWILIREWTYDSNQSISLHWFAAPPLGLTDDFVVDFSTNLLIESGWQPVETGIAGTPFGFVDWSGNLPTNTMRGYLRVGTEP
jgi:hypothetical protein